VFRAQCSQCHGTGGAGVQASGFPNLLDDDWLWGGTMEDIHQTVALRHPQRGPTRCALVADARLRRDGLLDEGEIDQVVQYVLRCRARTTTPNWRAGCRGLRQLRRLPRRATARATSSSARRR
jgi:cbb3-type cytochrome c oxidase subunit III